MNISKEKQEKLLKDYERLRQREFFFFFMEEMKCLIQKMAIEIDDEGSLRSPNCSGSQIESESETET